MSPEFRSRVCLLALAGLAITSLRGAENAGATAPASDTELRKIDGIFDTDLPKTERKGSVRLIVHPHMGDFTNRSYVRVLTGVRWGVNDHTELSASVEPYFDMSMKNGPSGNGIADVQLGAKYSFRDKLIPGYETSTGLNVFYPVGHPPLDLTTGYNRYSPYFVIGKKIASRPGLTVFFSTGLNILRKSSVPGSFRPNDPHSSSLSFTPGLVYDHGAFHYTLEFSYETTSLVGKDNKQFFTLRPGFAWDLPPKLKFHSRGRFTVGLGFHITSGPDGTTTGSGGKLRADFGISRWFRRDKTDDGTTR